MLEQHKIARLIWQADFSQAELAESAQNTLSYWSHNYLPGLLQQHFSQHCPEPGYWQIESIELDLGEIPAEELLDELPRRLSQSLTAWLLNWHDELKSKRIAPFSSVGNYMGKLKQDRQLETLSWFLRTGSYPWWHDGKALADLLNELMQSHQQGLRVLLLSLGEQTTIRWRLVRQFSSHLAAVIQLLEPVHGSWIVDYVEELLQHQRYDQVFPVSSHELQQKLWFTVLSQLVADRGSLFNQASFLRANLILLAQEFSLSYEELLLQLSHILTLLEMKGGTPNRWYATLAYLQQQESRAIRKAQLDDVETASETAPVWTLLQTMLHYQRRLYSQAGQDWHLAEVIEQAVSSNPAYLAHCLRAVAEVNATTDFLCTQLTTRHLYLLVRVLAPTDHPFIQLHLKQHLKMLKEKNWLQLPIWKLVLSYLLATKASYFNRRQFVAASLSHAAMNYTVDKMWLLNWMIQNLQSQHSLVHRFELLLILQELKRHETRVLIRDPIKPAAAVISQTSQNDAVSEPQYLASSLITLNAELITQTTEGIIDLQQCYTEQERVAELFRQIFALAGKQKLSLAELTKKLLRLSASANCHRLWLIAGATVRPDWLVFCQHLQDWARLLRHSPRLLAFCRRNLTSIAALRQQLTMLLLGMTKRRLIHHDDGDSDTSDLALIRQLIANLSAEYKHQARQFNRSLLTLIRHTEVLSLLAARPWYRELRFELEQGLQADRVTPPIPPEPMSSAVQGRCIQQKRLLPAAKSRQAQRRLAGDRIRQLLPKMKPAFQLASISKVANSSALNLSLWRWPDIHYLLLDSSLNSTSHRCLPKHLDTARRQLWHLLVKYAQTAASCGGRAAKSGWSTPGRDSSSSVVSCTQERLIHDARFPSFLSQCQTRLLQLQQVIRQNQFWHADQRSLQTALKQIVVQLLLAYRGVSISEADFYLRVIRLFVSDYASHAYDLLSRLALLPRRAEYQFLLQVVQADQRHRNTPLKPALATAFVSNESFELAQDYQQRYLRHPATQHILICWLDTGRLPKNLQHVEHWSIARLWQDAIQYGFDWRPIKNNCTSQSSLIAARIKSVLNPIQVQKLLAENSGMSREQLLGLKIWHRGLQNVSLSVRQDLVELWQFDLLQAWWQDENQYFQETRLLTKLADFFYRKNARQQRQLARDLFPLAKQMPNSWRHQMLLLLKRFADGSADRREGSAQFISAKRSGAAPRAGEIKKSANSLGGKMMTSKIANSVNRADQEANASREKKQSSVSSEQADENLIEKLQREFADEPSRPGKDLHLPVPIRNAGLVLLNSFIPMLFQRLNLLQENQFTDLLSQQHAALILHYLSTGAEHADEAELLLNKLLVGLEPEQSLPAAIEIDVSEMELCNSLLHFAIQNWSAIGCCSVDGFRGNWLIRNASLSDAGDHWRLIVEKRAYDVLLARSPYSYSLIRLPWMKKAIYVTWPT